MPWAAVASLTTNTADADVPDAVTCSATALSGLASATRAAAVDIGFVAVLDAVTARGLTAAIDTSETTASAVITTACAVGVST